MIKTTLSLPEIYHKNLRKIAIDRATTMADLICQAIKEKFFVNQSDISSTHAENLPLNKIKGILKDIPSTEKEIKNLKKAWAFK